MQKSEIKGSAGHKNLILSVMSAFFAALCAVCAQISFPLPGGVPVTLQTLGVCMCGYFMPLAYSELAIAVYVILGAVGVPVFSGFSGGFSVLVSPTGGFIFGFFLLAAACSLSGYLKNIFLKIICGFAGIILCHLAGVIWYSHLTRNSFAACFLTVSLPFLIKDFVCSAAACVLSSQIKKRGKFNFG